MCVCVRACACVFARVRVRVCVCVGRVERGSRNVRTPFLQPEFAFIVDPSPLSIAFFVFVPEVSDDSMLDKSTAFRSLGFPGESGHGLGCVT